MLIGIFILIGVIAMVYVFRRHGKGLGLQQGTISAFLVIIYNYIRSNQCNEV